MKHRLAAAAIALILGTVGPAYAGPTTKATAPTVWVAGRAMHFQRLTIAYGDPVAPAADPGLTEMLGAVGARMTWQPGTGFVAVTRADGKLVTFTVGSNVVTVDGAPREMPFAPYYRGSGLFVPLLPLARALGLGVRGYRSGYVFVPQIVSVSRRVGRSRTIVQIFAAVPVSSRSSFDARKRLLTLNFEGFGTDAGDVILGGRDAQIAKVRQSGPPGYPTTSVSIQLARGVKFAAHRAPSGAEIDVVLARDPNALHLAAAPQPSAIILKTPRPSPKSLQTPQPILPPSPAQFSPSPVATAEPVPSGAGQSALPSAEESPSPAAPVNPTPTSLPAARVTNVAIADLPGATRILLTLTGPVSFEWHRLDTPDNRYWLDLHNATLAGPAQTLATKLRFITEIKVSQHLISPEHVVRVSITPTQPIEVQVGPIEGSQNEMGVEIETAPPPSDEPRAGVGTIAFAPVPSPAVNIATRGDLIAIDPGHGGNDPGAINSAYGLVESHLTLQLSRMVRDRLQHLGWQVVMTRDADNEVGDPNGDDRQELQARCDVANSAGARLFVSIHMNSWVSSSLNGTTTYYWRRGDRTLAAAVESALIAADGLADDGVKRDGLYVVKHTNMPAILVEAAFLSNPHDAALLQQPWFMNKLADGIAKGIQDYSGGPQP